MSLLPAKVQLVGWKGGSFDKTWILYSGDTVDSEPWDLTGDEASCVFRDLKTNEVLLTLTTEDDEIELGDEEGIITIRIADEITADIVWPQAKFTLLLRHASGEVDPIFTGIMKWLGP